MTGNIFNIQRFCLHDGPGIRTLVFLKGCPLSCIWCHNPESRASTPQLLYRREKCTGCMACLKAGCEARTAGDGSVIYDRNKCTDCGMCASLCLYNACELCGKAMSAEDVYKTATRDKAFYEASGGGITISGGEPSYQPEFTFELMTLAKKDNINIAIETAGVGTLDFYKKANEEGALFLFDLKCGDEKKHKKLVGCEFERIHVNLKYLCSHNADIVLRLPLIPDVNDTDEDILGICKILDEFKGKYAFAEIMPYHDLGVSKSLALGEKSEKYKPGRDKIEIWKDKFSANGHNIKISV